MSVRDRIGQLLDRLSTCPGCQHSTDVDGCECRRDDCVCAEQWQPNVEAAIRRLSSE